VVAVRFEAKPGLCLAIVPLSKVYAGYTYTSINAPGVVDTDIMGINNSGDMVGDRDDPFGELGFLLSGGTFTKIAYPGVTCSGLRGINNVGQITGSTCTGDYADYGFLYQRGAFTDIKYPAAQYTDVNGIAY
jgi:hypothetical protein